MSCLKHYDEHAYDTDDYCPWCRVAELEAQLAEARKDSERLDWLSANSGIGSDSNISDKPGTILWTVQFDGPVDLRSDNESVIRAAIDAAREEE